jgi:hypothetical protein
MSVEMAWLQKSVNPHPNPTLSSICSAYYILGAYHRCQRMILVANARLIDFTFVTIAQRFNAGETVLG